MLLIENATGVSTDVMAETESIGLVFRLPASPFLQAWKRKAAVKQRQIREMIFARFMAKVLSGGFGEHFQ